MKAIVYDRYGPPEVLRVAEVPEPVIRDGELLVKVHAAAVSRADAATRDANRKDGWWVSLVSRLVFGVGQPRHPILGTNFAGEVAALGAGVSDFKVGDRVFGSTGFRFGGWAEFLTIPAARLVVPKPESVTFEQVAPATDGGLYAQCLKRADIGPGQRVLVYGASGAIGTAAIQLAKSWGAEVTGVTIAKNVQIVRALGADHVIDYTKDDFTANGEKYDVIMDAVGKHSYSRCRGSLTPNGRYIATDGLRNLVLALTTRQVIFDIPPRFVKADVLLLKNLIDAGRYRVVVDRVYPMDEVVEAVRYVETEQKVGNVVLTIP